MIKQLISHRGNIDGKILNEENNIKKILKVISLGYSVQIDLNFYNGKLFLGHDYKAQEISVNFLFQNSDKLWIHCKDIKSLNLLLNFKQNLNFFFHDKDQATLTSKGFIWTFPGIQLTKNSIAVLPQIIDYTIQQLNVCYGICSDNVNYYRRLFDDKINSF